MASRKASRPSTRDRILDAALDLFAKEGFGGTTITAVERQVGLTAGTGSFYRHFPSKEALLRAAVEREVERCVAVINEERASLVEPDDPDEARMLRLTQTLRDIRRFERLFRLMMTESDRVPMISEAIRAAVPWLGEREAWKRDPHFVVGVAALNGYYFSALLHGTNYLDIVEDDFIKIVADVTAPPDS